MELNIKIIIIGGQFYIYLKAEKKKILTHCVWKKDNEYEIQTKR